MRDRPIEVPETEAVGHVLGTLTSARSMRAWSRGSLLLVLTCLGCQQPPVPIPDAGAGLGPADAGSTTPFALTLTVSLADGGVEHHALLGLETPVVSPSRNLEVESNRRLHNARIRVLDETDRALPSDDVPEPTTEGLHYRIGLLNPLESGHRYFVMLDAQSGATLDDGTGRELPEQRLEFRTSGERERPKPATTLKRRHRKH
jgi:hypothetical protein